MELLKEYATNLFLPVDRSKIFHKYIGEVSGISPYDDNRHIIYLWDCPVGFVISEYCAGPGDTILITYQEYTYGNTLLFVVKSIDILPHNIVTNHNSLDIICLFCGRSLSVRKFKQCRGYAEEVLEYDIITEGWEHNGELQCSHCRDSIIGKCKNYKNTCTYCDTTRTIRF